MAAAKKSEAETVTVFHPEFPDVSRDIPSSVAQEWLEAGWLAAPLDLP